MLRFLNFSIKFLIVFSIVILIFTLSTLWYFSIGLPDYKKLSNYQPPISSRVYSSDGKLIAEYAIQKRLFVPYDSIPKVVIGSIDPNPKVSGNGVKILQKSGCIVKCGVLKKETDFANRRFLTFYQKKRPYIILKWAKRNVKKPIVVIGGINNTNYKKLINAGAKYIALSSFIWDNPKLKPEQAIRKFK